jgi:hypothetical protein
VHRPASSERQPSDLHAAHLGPAEDGRLLPSTQLLFYLLVGGTLVLFALWAINPVPCSDLWWQMKTGELIWTERAIPSTDRFSFMAVGRPWIIQEWATEVLFFLLYTKLGSWALVVFKMLTFAAAMGLGMAAAWTRCRNGSTAIATALLIGWAGHYFADMRPQMLSYFLLAALLLILERDRAVAGSRARWLIPPLMLLWANCHAGFMAGVTVLLALLAGGVIETWILHRTTRRGGPESEIHSRSTPRLLAPVLVALLAICVNPNGPSIFIYPFTLLRHNSMINFVQEWFSPDFHAEYMSGYELCLFLLPAALLLSRRPKRAADLLLLAIWAHQSLQSRRHVPIFLILALPILAEHLAGAGERLRELRLSWAAARPATGVQGRWISPAFRVPAALCGLVVLVGSGIAVEARSLPTTSLFDYSAGVAFFPRAACDFIEHQRWTGRIYNEFDWGGYCIWRFYPRQQVFIDGRCEVYFDGAWEDHQAVHYAQADWEQRLRAVQVDTLLVNPASYLNRVLPVSNEWRRLYADPIAMVYRRKQPFAL